MRNVRTGAGQFRIREGRRRVNSAAVPFRGERLPNVYPPTSAAVSRSRKTRRQEPSLARRRMRVAAATGLLGGEEERVSGHAGPNYTGFSMTTDNGGRVRLRLCAWPWKGTGSLKTAPALPTLPPP